MVSSTRAAPEAIAVVTDVYDALGFDTVSAGGLDESWRLERDRPGYGARQTAEEMRANLAAANRTLLARLAAAGLLECTGGRLRPTRAGMAVADGLAARFTVA